MLNQKPFNLNNLKSPNLVRKLNIFFIIIFVLQSCENKSNKVNKSINNTFYSERIRDSLFENVIEITDEHIEQNGTNYIFKFQIPKSEDPPILFFTASFPIVKLSEICPNYQSIIVITSNDYYYDEVSKNLGPDVCCAEPRTSNIIYEFNKKDGTLKKDSIIIMDTFPNINFKKK